MAQFNRILFPVDFSEACKATVPFVKAMAEQFQATVVALHVVDMPVSMYALPDASGFDMLAQLEAMHVSRRAQFDAFLANELAGVSVESELVEGDPAHEINTCARDKKIDLIMMPTRGQGPLRRFLLGSVTAKVLHDADVPVWTSAHGFEAQGAPVGRYRQILCGVDTETREIPVIEWAAEFARKQGACLRIIHAAGALKSRAGEDDPLVRAELFNLAHQGLAVLQKSAGVDCEVVVRGGKPEHAIHDAAQDLSAELVVIGRGGIRGALGRLRSHAYAIIREAPCPVISV